MDFFMIFSIIGLFCSTCSLKSSSSPLFASPSQGFMAPLIHRSSPESPFYEPKATEHDIMRDSLRTSFARSAYFNRLWSNKTSMKYPISPIDIFSNNYVMKYSVGTPPVETFAVPDTGSTLIWMQCLDCINCYKQSIPYFDPSKSSSYKQVTCIDTECIDLSLNNCRGTTEPCMYNITYVDGSHSFGNLAKETLTFLDSFNGNKNSYSLTNMLFGCGHDNTDLPGAAIPGVVGLNNHPYSLVGQLGFDMFSYCVSSNVTAGHSQIRFGLTAIISGRTTTAYFHSNSQYFFQNVEGLYVDGEKVEGIPAWVFQSAPGGLLLDSGTTFTELYGLALDLLMGEIRAQIDVEEEKDATHSWDLCYNLKQRPIVLPEIEFRFTDTNNTFPLSDNNAWIDNKRGQLCLAIGRSSDTVSTLGMYQQRDVNVGFDLKRQKITFLYNTNCPQYV